MSDRPSAATTFLLFLLAAPVTALTALLVFHATNTPVAVPPSVFPYLDPVAAHVAPLLGRVEPNVLKMEGHNDTVGLGRQGCWVDTRLSGCEDVEIHHPSSTAFLACASSLEARRAWFPPLAWRGNPDPALDKLFAYNLRAWTRGGALTPLSLKYPDGAVPELRTHGLGLWYASKPLGAGKAPKDASVRMFAVNHKHSGSCVTVFDHTLGSAEAAWVRDVCHPDIVSPNDVAPTSPNSFLVTNDHMFLLPPLRTLEDRYGPFPVTSVAHCTFSDLPDAEPECRRVATGLIAANGVLVSPDGRTAWVCSSRGGSIGVFDLAADGSLTERDRVAIGSGVDNLSHDPRTNTTLFALFPSRSQLYLHFHHTSPASSPAPSGVGRLVPGSEKGWELVYHDDGAVLADVTAAAADSGAGKTVLGGVMAEGIAVCPKAW
ncbi:hypothetical protein DFJ74DRAFT_439557 [Hyaloraphidium curvatum]|nr:hypothetical protein DFJ74DRAFT_439557 [Hyaloraphidium curvatum]